MTNVTINPAKLKGLVKPPSSKSVTHRAMILAALHQSKTIIHNFLDSEDTRSTLNGLAKLGMKYDIKDKDIIVKSGINFEFKNHVDIDCGNSGTTLRLLMGVLPKLKGSFTLFGDDSLNSRPIGPLVDALGNIGISIECEGNTAPVTFKVQGVIKSNGASIDGSISSQFVSALIILGSLFEELMINIRNNVVSEPYIELTIQMFEQLGFDLEKTDTTIKIYKKNDLIVQNYEVPMDYSSSAFFIAAGVLNGNRIKIKGRDADYIQADNRIIAILRDMGAIIKSDNNGDLVSYTFEKSNLIGRKIDISSCPDLFPILSVIATQAKGRTEIYGASHLKFKETNRIKEMVTLLTQMGAIITEKGDGAIIENSKLKGGIIVDPKGDHRLAMALAIAGTVSEKPIEIINSECVNVSYPNFFNDLKFLSRDKGKV